MPKYDYSVTSPRLLQLFISRLFKEKKVIQSETLSIVYVHEAKHNKQGEPTDRQT